MKIIEACLEAIQSAYDDLQSVRDEEEEAYDNLPEGIQMGDRGDMMQDAIDTIDEAISSLDDVVSYLEEATSPIDEDLIMEHDSWDDLQVGDVVSHKYFGLGVISKREGAYITVNFDYKVSQFKIPDSFTGGFLTIKNDEQ